MKFILATGGSGGHLFPAIEVAEELRSRGHSVVFVGSFAQQIPLIMKRRFEYILLNTKGFLKSQFFSASWLMLRTFLKSFSVLKREKPNVVIGFGGHGSFGVVLAAVFKRIPTMIHEQNVTPGRANRCLARFVQKIAVSFANTQDYFSPQKTTVTGCPTHLRVSTKDRDGILKAWGLKPDKKTILVFGGSQGAQRINEIFLKTAWLMQERLDFQVIHITGQNDFSNVKQRYESNQLRAKVFSFLDEMAEAYSVSDIVISRAGAVTVKELALFKKKAVLIPYPFAGNHQKENALMLAKINVVRIIEENHLTAQALMKSILDLLNQELTQRKKVTLITDSSRRVADLALSLG